MADVYVDNLSYSLGDRQFTVAQSAAEGRIVSDAAQLTDCGFRCHHVCSESESSYTLACDAVQNIAADLGRVEAIVYSTCIPANASISEIQEYKETGDVKHLMNYAGSHLQAEFGLVEAQVFGIGQQACTGMIGSLRLAQMLINSDSEIDRVLCLTADRFPAGALYEQAYNLISDGAAACTVSRAPGAYKIIASHAITNGAMAAASDEETVGSFFTYSHLVITKALAKAKLSVADIAWVAAQNTNAKAWQILASLLKLDHKKVFHATLPDIGHMISGDNIANLLSMEKQRMVQAGDKVLLFMAGFGLNWQCLILEKTNVRTH
jgi:3-oxoacyl-[acyl-carrier-protein] synthase III